MSKPNIVLTRVDNRLIHGQVGLTWTTSLGVNLVIVADDKLVEDRFQQDLMRVVTSTAGVNIRFFTIEMTIKAIPKASERQKIFLVCRTLADARRLLEGGVPIEQLNIGNLHFVKGKKAISKKVYVDDKDLEDLKAIKNTKIKVFIQDVPGDIKEYIK